MSQILEFLSPEEKSLLKLANEQYPGMNFENGRVQYSEILLEEEDFLDINFQNRSLTSLLKDIVGILSIQICELTGAGISKKKQLA